MSEQSTKNKTCSFPGCTNIRKGNGLCGGHWWQNRYGRQLTPLFSTKRRPGSPPVILYDEVPCLIPELEGPCHVFRAGKDNHGYGRVSIGRCPMVKVHRHVWERDVGPTRLIPQKTVFHLQRSIPGKHTASTGTLSTKRTQNRMCEAAERAGRAQGSTCGNTLKGKGSMPQKILPPP